MLLQWLIVGVLVLGSAAYALWALISPRLRLRLLRGTERLIGATALTSGLRRRAEAGVAGGCSNCEANVAAGKPGASPSAGSRSRSPTQSNGP